jgi:hypothetical protein
MEGRNEKVFEWVLPRKKKQMKEQGVTLEQALRSVGRGWEPLIKEVYLEMATCPGFYLTQVKEKFGMLRIYWGGDYEQQDIPDYSIKFNNFIVITENKSGQMCETCGNDGEVIDDNGWLRACCPEHVEKRGV